MEQRARRVWTAALAIASAGCGGAATPPPPRPPPEPAPEQRVYVTIDADFPRATLVQERGTARESVCVAPCDRVIVVPRDARFRIMAPGARPTSDLYLYSPQDPVVWIDFHATKESTHQALRATFLTTILTGSALALTALVTVPLVKDKGAQTALSGVGFAGLMLALPVGLILGLTWDAYSRSDARLKDPSLRPDLRR